MHAAARARLSRAGGAARERNIGLTLLHVKHRTGMIILAQAPAPPRHPRLAYARWALSATGVRDSVSSRLQVPCLDSRALFQFFRLPRNLRLLQRTTQFEACAVKRRWSGHHSMQAGWKAQGRRAEYDMQVMGTVCADVTKISTLFSVEARL